MINITIGTCNGLYRNTGEFYFAILSCLLIPTDCIKDRLAAYFFWNDQQSLDQAVMVEKSNKIHLSEIKEWVEKQGEIEKYKVFKKKCREEGSNTKAK